MTAGAPCVDKSMVCTAARSTARPHRELAVRRSTDDGAEPARVVAKLVIGDGVVTTQRRPPFSDHNASVVDAATTTDASTSKIASFVAAATRADPRLARTAGIFQIYTRVLGDNRPHPR